MRIHPLARTLLGSCKLLHGTLEPLQRLGKEALKVGAAPQIDVLGRCPNFQDSTHRLKEREQPNLLLRQRSDSAIPSQERLTTRLLVWIAANREQIAGKI